MEIYTAPNDYRNYLAHHGIMGMRWGIRYMAYRAKHTIKSNNQLKKFKKAIS